MAIAVLAGISMTASAANKFWGGPSGTGASPVSGTWDTSTLNWSTTAAGASSAAFTTGDTATFGGAYGLFIKCSTLSCSTITNNNSYTFTNDTP
ncbi:MAG: hypothetical protein JF609_09845, partial [Verrucomicrobia bacterium]|nr:hypothetical protein [Verrucomicrobiota bacterium]